MADPRFFKNEGPFTLTDLAQRIDAELKEGVDGSILVDDVRPLDEAGEGHLSFIDNPKYMDVFSASSATAIITAPKNIDKAPSGVALLVSHQPYRSYAMAAQAFYPSSVKPRSLFGATPGETFTSTVHPSAQIDPTAIIEPGAIVGAGAEVGAGTVISGTAFIGENCAIGCECYIGPGASIIFSLIGDRVLIHPGVRLGQDGFGFAMGLPSHEKIPQLGRVIVQDDVEIGANSAVDRGASPDTVIGAGTKIDNLVQIGHNAHIGAGCILVAQGGISGSTHIEDYVAMGARATAIGHITIGSGAQIAARSSVVKDVEPGARMGGTPAKPVVQWKRELVAIAKLGRPKKR